MSLLQYVQKLYSLDTLDPRFTASAKASATSSGTQIDPAKPSPKEGGAGIRPRNGGQKAITSNEASPPLWNTAEFYIYYLIFLICVPLMFKSVYDVSKRTCAHISGQIPGLY